MASHKKISEKSPRKLAKDKQRQHLLNANIECIAKMGLSETSITHISKAANMSRGIINFYFDSKEKMMLETLDYLLAQQTSLWNSVLEDKEVENNFEAVAVKLLMSSSRRHQRAWMAFAAHAASHTAYAQKFTDSTQELSSTLQSNGGSASETERFLLSLAGLRVEFLLSKASLSKEKKLSYIKEMLTGMGSEHASSSNDNATKQDKKKQVTIQAAPKAKQAKAKKADIADAAIGDLFASLG